MKVYRLLFSVSIVALVTPALGEPEPRPGLYEVRTHFDPKIAIRVEPSSDPVNVIGSFSSQQPMQPAVFAVDIGEPTDMENDSSKAEFAPASDFPSDSLLPDANGTITVHTRQSGDRLKKAIHRNPWEVSVRGNAVSNESMFFCGGVIIGSVQEEVAFLNNRVVRLGDKTGSFIVAGIYPEGIVLGRNALFFVIPRGRRVIINLVDI
jgi:hypothetical protein